MVGFKSIGLLISLLVLGACVPQTKQTDCATNEAFNATLRTCVPVMNGPSSFINIASYTPTSVLSKYKSDTTSQSFTVFISNPYAQTYSVEWERVFNGSPVTLIANTTSTSSSTSIVIFPTLTNQIGTHVITAKIKDTNGIIVDSHNFEMKINDIPKPIIKSSTVIPINYSPNSYSPLTAIQPFSFEVLNNNATMTTGGGTSLYQVVWKLYRGGVLIDTQTNVFPTVGGTLVSTGSNFPIYNFDPGDSVLGGLGSYIVNARLMNTSNEVVAEQQWSATVAHPALSNISSRNIYDLTATPLYTTSSIAYDGIPYNQATSYNFIPSTVVSTFASPALGAQGNYCVSVIDGEGTYLGDSLYVKVNFYLDNGTIVYSGLTSALDNKVCLTDSLNLSSVVFNNPSPNSSLNHVLTARAWDEATGQEYTQAQMPGLGSYPISWGFDVRPQNTAPTVDFGSVIGSTLSSCTTAGTTRSGCTVTSDTNFKVKINLTGDDFYYPISSPAHEAKFNYSIRLYQNGVNIQTCSKSGYSIVDPLLPLTTDQNGADGYECEFVINSFNGSGPLILNNNTYQIQADIMDYGSEITAAGKTSSTLIWNFAPNGVIEKNTAPLIAGVSISNATEGSALSSAMTFSASITDAERDNFTWALKYCTDLSCSSPVTITGGTVIRTSNAASYPLTGTVNFAENFLLNLTALNCHTKLRGLACAVNFFLQVTDLPNTATPLMATSGQSTSNITNYNPVAALNTLLSLPVPAPSSPLSIFVGHPFSIFNNPASILTDTSAVPEEKNYRYQWFVKNNTSVTTYQPIDGATGNNLLWTPSLMRDITDNSLQIILCVEDQPISAVPTVLTTLAQCNTLAPWTINVRNNVATAQNLTNAPSSTDLAASSSNTGTETAIWYDTPASTNTSVISSAAYIAMIGNDERIHVKKVLVRSDGQIDTLNSSLMISFDAVPTGVTDSVKDLSITGTSNGSELYIAYLASRTGSPSTFYPQVRRIDLTSSLGKSAPNDHPGKFGFDYDGLGFINNCVNIPDCTATTTSGVTSVSFSTTGNITGDFTLQTPNGNFTFFFGAPNTTNTICSACSGPIMASSLATLINSSVDPILAGYSAVASGSSVTIYGASAIDYFDSSAEPIARSAGRMGKIYITAGSWFVPFIDNSLGGAYTHKISVYSASTGGNMSNFTEGVTDPFNPSATGLISMMAPSKFDNFVEGSNLWIAMVTETGSTGKLYKLNAASLAFIDQDDIFPGQSLTEIQVAASSTRVYTGVTSSGQLKLGIYDFNGTIISEFKMDDAPHVDPLSDTEKFFNTADIAKYQIVPYGSEARIFGVSKGALPTAGSTYSLYMARLREVSSTWTISCGDCKTISELGANLSQYVSLGVAPIRDNPNSNYQLSTSGYIAGQGNKDVAFLSFGRLDPLVLGHCDPAIGVFNAEGEAINATTIFDGSSFNPASPKDSGLFRSPFVKN